ncbi:hypothetical protein HanIR_Chr09g0450231 [Helianthus annuus]|nr:hypothetical protein HanIR_Chr09g0450231 [Helianthus annuus]
MDIKKSMKGCIFILKAVHVLWYNCQGRDTLPLKMTSVFFSHMLIVSGLNCPTRPRLVPQSTFDFSFLLQIRHTAQMLSYYTRRLNLKIKYKVF